RSVELETVERRHVVVAGAVVRADVVDVDVVLALVGRRRAIFFLPVERRSALQAKLIRWRRLRRAQRGLYVRLVRHHGVAAAYAGGTSAGPAHDEDVRAGLLIRKRAIDRRETSIVVALQVDRDPCAPVCGRERA